MIVIFYLLLFTLLLWVIIGGRGNWLVKSTIIVPCIWFSIAIGVSLSSMMGWPSDAELPEKYEVFWLIVENPNLTTGEKGSILVWAKARLDVESTYSLFELYRPDKVQPRVHKIPYSKQMHKQANEALKSLKKGERVEGTNKKGGKTGMKGKGKGKGGKGKGRGRKGDGKGGGTTGGGEENDPSVGPKFYKMPPIKMPEKS